MIRDLAAAIIGKGQLLQSQDDRVGHESWRGLWTASSDSWCQSTILSLASSQAEAQ